MIITTRPTGTGCWYTTIGIPALNQCYAAASGTTAEEAEAQALERLKLIYDDMQQVLIGKKIIKSVKPKQQAKPKQPKTTITD